MTNDDTFDHIVVGAGSAGCVVARRLSDAGQGRTLVLEAGSTDLSPYLRIPAGRMRMNDKYDWNYPVEPDASRQGKPDHWESGKVLGGSSTINGMFWARGSRADFDGWARAGCPGWDYQSVLPYFRRSESFSGGADEYRGGDGPLSVSTLSVHHPLTETFVVAAQCAGHRFNDDYNGSDLEGVGYGQVTQQRGLRHSAATAFLRPLRGRRNIQVRTRAFVRRLLFDGTRVVGVEYERDGARKQVFCRREVILSAGALGTPKILLLSGVGDGASLRSLGIPQVAEVPGVGQNLQNHVYLAMIYEVDVPTLNRELTLSNVVRGGLQLALRGTGTATSAFGHAVIFGATGDRGVDYQAIFAPYGLFAPRENGRGRHKMRLMPVNAVTVRVGLMRCESTGRLTLRSANPHDPPVVDYELVGNAGDVATLVAASRMVREVMATEPMLRHVRSEISPGVRVADDAAWESTVRRTAEVGKHAAGTCKMGTDDDSVVDHELLVRGTQGLRVVDMSIVPTITSANTNAVATMIGERGADFAIGSGGSARTA